MLSDNFRLPVRRHVGRTNYDRRVWRQSPSDGLCRLLSHHQNIPLFLKLKNIGLIGKVLFPVTLVIIQVIIKEICKYGDMRRNFCLAESLQLPRIKFKHNIIALFYFRKKRQSSRILDITREKNPFA